MSSAAPRSRWRFVIAPRWLAWHAFTVAAVVGMLWLGLWQFRRAESGNALSWAYTFEWPVFAAFGIVFWAKTILDEARRGQAGPAADDDAARQQADAGLPAGRHQPAGVAAAGDEADAAADTELDEYNAYLAKLSKQVHGHGRWHGLR